MKKYNKRFIINIFDNLNKGSFSLEGHKFSMWTSGPFESQNHFIDRFIEDQLTSVKNSSFSGLLQSNTKYIVTDDDIVSGIYDGKLDVICSNNKETFYFYSFNN